MLRVCFKADFPECANTPTLVAGGLLLDGSGHSSGGGFPEWVAPAFGGLLCEGGVLVKTKDRRSHDGHLTKKNV